MAPQGKAHFTGLFDIRAASMTFSAHGITPSVCAITAVPRQGFASSQGTLEFEYGGTRIVFHDCSVDLATLRFTRGGQLVTFNIKDRRWKWEYGSIDGRYNRRKPDGSVDREDKETKRRHRN